MNTIEKKIREIEGLIYNTDWSGSDEDAIELAGYRNELSDLVSISELIQGKENYLFSEIIIDNEIKCKYDEIQKIDTTSFYHGFKHVLNVCNNMIKLTDALNINDKETDKLLIAATLHDIGRGETGKEHEIKGRNFSEEYLRRWDLNKYELDESDINDILTAIEFHDHKDNLDELPFFTNLVCLADKLDITKKRVNLKNELDPALPSYQYDIFREIYLDVNDLFVKIDKDKFVVEIVGNENLSEERLLQIPFMQLVRKNLEAFSSKINMEPMILVNCLHQKSR